MEQLVLKKITGTKSLSDGGDPIRIDEQAAMEKPHELWQSADGTLHAVPTGDQPEKGATQIATLKCLDEDGAAAWYMACHSRRLGVNGTTPPLPLVRLEPGTLLSVDRDFWWVAKVTQPEPIEAPPEVAECTCPVCGGKLSEAPVVECGCGRWTHLEKPEQPDSPDALNCFLAAPECPQCHHPATLDPIIVPEPDEKLLPADVGATY